MPVNLILGLVALMGGALVVGLLLMIIVGIHRGDRGRRLTGRPGSNCEAFARRLLTGSRGYELPRDAGEDR
jgi:hypothetical protein